MGKPRAGGGGSAGAGGSKKGQKELLTIDGGSMDTRALAAKGGGTSKPTPSPKVGKGPLKRKDKLPKPGSGGKGGKAAQREQNKALLAALVKGKADAALAQLMRAEAEEATSEGEGGFLKPKAFLRKGYQVVKGALTAAHRAQLVAACEAAAPDLSLKHQFHQPDDPARYEYMLAAEHPGLSEVAQHVWERMVEPVAGSLVPSDCFCIVSEPGSKGQPWHTDSIPSEELPPPLWASTLSYIGILTPLVDTDKVCGRTEVQRGSHVGEGEPIKLSMRVGDCLVMDGRTLHRGLGNRSEGVMRRMAFLTYKLPTVQDGNATAYH